MQAAATPMIRHRVIPSTGESLPEWGMGTWAPVFRKFLTSHPVVACAIPAAGVLDHFSENPA